MSEITAVEKGIGEGLFMTEIPGSITSEFRLKEDDRLAWDVAEMDGQPVIVITPVKLERID